MLQPTNSFTCKSLYRYFWTGTKVKLLRQLSWTLGSTVRPDFTSETVQDQSLHLLFLLNI